MLTQQNFVSNVVAGCSILPFDSRGGRALVPAALARLRADARVLLLPPRGDDRVRRVDRQAARQPGRGESAHLRRRAARLREGLRARPGEPREVVAAASRSSSHRAIEVGQEGRSRCKSKKETPDFALALQHFVFERLVYRKVRAALGTRFRFAVSGGAPLARELAEFFWAIGVEVYEGYGLTETSPVIAVNCPSAWRLGAVGKILPGRRVPDRLRRRDPDPRAARHEGLLTASRRRRPRRSTPRAGSTRATSASSTRTGSSRSRTARRRSSSTRTARTSLPRRSRASSRARTSSRCPSSSATSGSSSPASSSRTSRSSRRGRSRTASPAGRWSSSCRSRASWRSSSRRSTAGTTGSPTSSSSTGSRVLPKDLTIESGELTPTLKVKRRIVDQHYKHLIDAMYEGAGA